MKTLSEVRERIAEIDATMKKLTEPWRKLRSLWTAYERALKAEAELPDNGKDEPDV